MTTEHCKNKVVTLVKYLVAIVCEYPYYGNFVNVVLENN